MVGLRGAPPNGSGMVASASFAVNCQAPAGLLVSSHSWPYRVSRKLLSHFVGVGVQTTSRPLVIASLADAGSEGTLPAEALHFEGAALGFGTDEVAVARAVRLADSVPSDDERRRLLVVHRHPTERLADVLGRSQRDPVGPRGPQGSRRSDPWLSHRTASRGPDRRNSARSVPNHSSSSPKRISSGSQMSSRPKPKPNVFNPMDW